MKLTSFNTIFTSSRLQGTYRIPPYPDLITTKTLLSPSSELPESELTLQNPHQFEMGIR